MVWQKGSLFHLDRKFLSAKRQYWRREVMNPWPPQPMTEAGETCHLCWIAKASQRTFKEASERSINTPILSSAWCRTNFNTLKIKMQQQFYVEMLLKLPSLMILCSSHRKKNNLITYCWCLLILLIRKKKSLDSWWYILTDTDHKAKIMQTLFSVSHEVDM